MDIHQIIRELNDERRHLERIIESLEMVVRTGGGSTKPPSRRGRKSMDAVGRQEVSARMKRYWARRREERAAGAMAQGRSASDTLTRTAHAG